MTCEGENLKIALEQEWGFIQQTVKKPLLSLNDHQPHLSQIVEQVFEIDNEKLTVKITKASLIFSFDAISQSYPQKVHSLKLVLSYYSHE
jgi:hypothetical protein